MTALNNQTVGQSLTLQCEVTAVRGITSRVDIVWRDGNGELNRTNNVTATMDNDLLVYTHNYTYTQELNTGDDDEFIQCDVVINTSPPVMMTGSITLDIISKYILCTSV